MSTEANKAIVRRSVEEGWNTPDWAAVDECYAEEYVHRDPSNPQLRDREGLKQFGVILRAAFPDFRVEIDELIAEGDRVAKVWTVRGTHRGELFGTPPTGKPVAMTGTTVYRIEGGQIVEGRWNYDLLGLLQQIGAIPAPGQAGLVTA